MSHTHKFLASGDVLASRWPYAQTAFSGCFAGNTAVDPLEVAVAFGRASVPKLVAVVAIGAQITAQPDQIEATEVEGVVQATEAALVRAPCVPCSVLMSPDDSAPSCHGCRAGGVGEWVSAWAPI